MNIAATISNLALMAFQKNYHQIFLKACEQPERVQSELLRKILNKNSSTRFGKSHSFKKIASVDDFRKHVPVMSYDDYTGHIRDILRGEKKVLTTEVDYMALTSGSVAASKYIPYNRELKEEFNRGVYPWLYDLYSHYKKLKSGKQFWIITPVTSPDRYPQAAVPVGFENDLDYFGKLGRVLLKQVMVLPESINRIDDPLNYFYLVSLFLLMNKDLRLISVWNPSLLFSILDCLRNNYPQLCRDISAGTINLPVPSVRNDIGLTSLYTRKMTRRGRYLTDLKEFNASLVWPDLTLISCWTDAWASVFLEDIKDQFPGVPVQGKGLLATEGIITIPLSMLEYPVLAIRSHFFEFISQEDGNIYLPHELKEQSMYEVIITTSGGLYRYRLNDMVQVEGFYKRTPLLRFTGKKDIISDMCGEKLHEAFVSEVLKEVSSKYFSRLPAMFLAPSKKKNSFQYVLYLAAEGVPAGFIADLDSTLMRNFHYRHCRKMDQLREPSLKLIKSAEAMPTRASGKDQPLSGTGKTNFLITRLTDPDDIEGIFI